MSSDEEQPGGTTETDSRSQRNRASRGGGQVLTRARSSSCKSGLPWLGSSDHPGPDPRRLRPLQRAGQGDTDFIPDTNLVESINYQLRKVTKTRGHFPTDAAALKLLRLAARNISDKRGGDLGTGTWGWSQALNAFEIHFPGRLGLTNH